MRKILRAMRGQKGFTLIELLVVVGILAALAGVVTLAVGQFIGEGACEGYCTEKHNMQTAIVAYMAQNAGAVPGWGDIEPYLTTTSKYDWTGVTIDTDGKIAGDVGQAADPHPPADCYWVESG